MQELLGASAYFRGRQELAYGEHSRLGNSARRALVGDRELREAVDLVAPQVDAHRMIGGGRIDVDDRAPHRDLAARFDLVLAAVAEVDEPGDELVAVELHSRRHRDRLDVLDVRAQALHERAHRRDDRVREVLATGTQPPHHPEAAAHRLGRGRHPFERERLPRREELDRVVAEVLAQVGGDALRLDARRDREHDRPAGRGAGQRRGEQRPGRLRHRDRARPALGRGRNDRIVGEQHGQIGKRWSHRSRTRVNTRNASHPGVAIPIVPTPFGSVTRLTSVTVEVLQTVEPRRESQRLVPTTQAAAGRPAPRATCSAICQSVKADVNSNTLKVPWYGSLPQRFFVELRALAAQVRTDGLSEPLIYHRWSIRRFRPLTTTSCCSVGRGSL